MSTRRKVNTRSASAAAAAAVELQSASTKRSSKRKSTPSMENLNETTSPPKVEETSGENDPTTSSSIQEMLPVATANFAHRRLVDRLLASSAVYLKCNVLCYDEKLHQSLDKAIKQLEELEEDVEQTPDELLATLTERHLELLNLRMKLLKCKDSADVVASSSGTKTGTKVNTTTSVPNTELSAASGACFYCHADHPPEACTVYRLERRSNIIKKRKRCFRCLGPFSTDHTCEAKCRICDRRHHVSLCKQDPSKTKTKQSDSSKGANSAEATGTTKQPVKQQPSKRNQPPIPEPPLPTVRPLPARLTHPTSLMLNLLSADGEPAPDEPIHYRPVVTAVISTATTKAFARVFVNITSGIGCFVSESFLTQMSIRPIRLAQPIEVRTLFFSGAFNVTEYAILEVSSPYRESYRYKDVFYVVPMGHHYCAMPSANATRLAEARGVKLSNNYDPDPNHNLVDIYIGRNNLEPIGFQMDPSRQVTLSTKLSAYYTHFGYLLWGGEDSPEQQQRQGQSGSSSSRTNRPSGGAGASGSSSTTTGGSGSSTASGGGVSTRSKRRAR